MPAMNSSNGSGLGHANLLFLDEAAARDGRGGIPSGGGLVLWGPGGGQVSPRSLLIKMGN